MLKSASQGEDLASLHQSIVKKYSSYQMEDYQMMQSQLEILEEIKDKLQRKRTFESSHHSFASNSFSSLPVFTASDECFRNRFSEQFQNSILDSAMREVKNNCSQDTYETLAAYVSTHRGSEDLKKDLEKKGKEIEELSALLIIKQKDNCFLERDIFALRQREAEIEEEKRKIKKRGELLNEKEKRLHGVEMSLIFKEKLSLQVKRRYQRQRDLNQATEQQLQKVYNQLNSIWNKILQTNADGGLLECSSNCWKQQIMRRCKQQLVQQRRILKEQSLQIELEYETMQCLSEQIKKVLIPPQGKRTDELLAQK